MEFTVSSDSSTSLGFLLSDLSTRFFFFRIPLSGSSALVSSPPPGLLQSLLPGVPFGSVESMACVTTVESKPKPKSTSTSTSQPRSPLVPAKGISVVVDNLLLADKSIVMVSACQGKGAGPADAIGREIAQRIAGVATLETVPGEGLARPVKFESPQTITCRQRMRQSQSTKRGTVGVLRYDLGYVMRCHVT
mmetsp:Transcript_18352/g.38242  ORF Transcript_18352/g.38242 Transcript_18352/m.38242 type:complete len:192 (-) Transcript_18352:104-679(-)